MTNLERILVRALVDEDFLEQLKKEDYDISPEYSLNAQEKETLQVLRSLQNGQGLDALVHASSEAISHLVPSLKNPPERQRRVEFSRIESKLDRVAPKLERVAPKLERVAPKLERVAPKLERVAPKLERVEPKLERVAPKLERIEPKLERVEPKLERVASILERVEPKLERIILELEQGNL